MKVQRIYVDTSVIGGCHDPEFAEWSNRLIRDFEEGRYRVVISEIVTSEIHGAPANVREIYDRLVKTGPETIGSSPEADVLAEMYIQRGILTQRSLADATHIALATIANADILVSWNFRDIVHFDRINRFNSVNIELGYKPILIHSPQEVASYG